MAFEHESFWIAIAAAAPIIALANQISLTDALSSASFLLAARIDHPLLKTVGKMNVRAAYMSYFTGAANLILQTTALSIALVSLATEEDAFSAAVPLAVALEIVGLLAIGATAAFSGLVRGLRTGLEEAIRERWLSNRRAREALEALPGTDSDPEVS